MKTSQVYASKFLTSEDVKDGEVEVTIREVKAEAFPGQGGKTEIKLVAYFHDSLKPMIINKTNSKIIESVLGDETDNWKDGRLTLMVLPVVVQGVVKNSINVRMVQKSAKKPLN